MPEPEHLEPETPENNAARHRETTPVDTVSGPSTVEVQNRMTSSGHFDPEPTPASRGETLDQTRSASGDATDSDVAWRTNPNASTHDATQPDWNEPVPSVDAHPFRETAREIDGAASSNDRSASASDAEPSQEENSGWQTPGEAEPSKLDSIDDSSALPPTANEADEADENSFQPTGDLSPANDGESILETIAAERARVAAAQGQSNGAPQWIKNPFLSSSESSAQSENATAEAAQPGTGQDFVAANAIPKVPSVTPASDTEIQSNRQPASQSIGSEHVESRDEVAPNRSAEMDAASHSEAPGQGLKHPSAARQTTSHHNTNIYMVVNMPPPGEKTSDIGASGGSSGSASGAVRRERCQRQRAIVLRAIPADLTGEGTPALTENLAIPAVRPVPLAPLRGNRAIWAAEPVQRTPAQNVSFVRPGGEIESSIAGQALVDPVNRGVRLRDLPKLERMPQTPAPFVLPRTLNSPVSAVDPSAESQRQTDIERLPVRLHAVPQDGHGQPASTGTRARIRVIQPSYQRRVQPVDDTNIRNNQTQYAPTGLPSIDVDRFDRELRTLSERPESATATRVRR